MSSYRLERRDIDVSREFDEEERSEFYDLLSLLSESDVEYVAETPPSREGSA